jgi:hypothetical protein
MVSMADQFQVSKAVQRAVGGLCSIVSLERSILLSARWTGFNCGPAPSLKSQSARGGVALAADQLQALEAAQRAVEWFQLRTRIQSQKLLSAR